MIEKNPTIIKYECKISLKERLFQDQRKDSLLYFLRALFVFRVIEFHLGILTILIDRSCQYK